MRSRLLVGLASVLAVSMAALSTPTPVSYATTTSPITAPADPQLSVVQPKAPQVLGPVLFTPAPDDRPKVIDPATYNKYTGPNLSKRVVLTFDDCPRTLTQLQAVLDYAAANNIGLVLAPTGKCFAYFQKKYKVNIAELIRSRGQYAINHSYSHPNLTKLKKNGTLDVPRVKAQLTTEIKTDYGRPPYGARNSGVDRVYASVGMREWLWNKDTEDWKDKSQKQIVTYVITHAEAGDTVLMHMQHNAFNPSALAAIKAGLEARKDSSLYLCRPFRGWANPFGAPVRVTPVLLGDHAIPC